MSLGLPEKSEQVLRRPSSNDSGYFDSGNHDSSLSLNLSSSFLGFRTVGSFLGFQTISFQKDYLHILQKIRYFYSTTERAFETPFRSRELLFEKQKLFQSIHKHTYLKGPYDKIIVNIYIVYSIPPTQ
ncbi:uncharacterized protein LOC131314077 [Rhododendron vialii]|uniref:uncharacterized protein LOC131314077 n=1 Tax=Rhododendron vialii TaxID=182163 RepID=UPI00265DCBAD|nr:uncharacterized protein LOC131314077 [Rhododendron vialii]